MACATSPPGDAFCVILFTRPAPGFHRRVEQRWGSPPRLRGSSVLPAPYSRLSEPGYTACRPAARSPYPPRRESPSIHPYALPEPAELSYRARQFPSAARQSCSAGSSSCPSEAARSILQAILVGSRVPFSSDCVACSHVGEHAAETNETSVGCRRLSRCVFSHVMSAGP